MPPSTGRSVPRSLFCSLETYFLFIFNSIHAFITCLFLPVSRPLSVCFFLSVESQPLDQLGHPAFQLGNLKRQEEHLHQQDKDHKHKDEIDVEYVPTKSDRMSANPGKMLNTTIIRANITKNMESSSSP